MTQEHRALPWRHVHFIGIGGVGMTGLALILSDRTVAISGTDSDDSANLRLLRRRSEAIHIGHEAAHLPAAADLVVYSSAVPASNPERLAAIERGLPCLRRGEFLAALAPSFDTVIAVAGSHGKTTVTAMTAWLLHAANRHPGYLIGGQPLDMELPAAAGDGAVLVTEVDESDTTQALMHADIAIVTNVDDDHCWSVGGEAALDDCFRTFARQATHLIAGDSPRTRQLFADHPDATWIGEAGIPADLSLPLPGLHNRLDATLAIHAAMRLGITQDEALPLLARFHGVERRQSLRYEANGIRIIEDYAHHPIEVAATIQALREAWPASRLRVVFQPHRYERVARYALHFARELSAADEVFVTTPFSAWLDDTDLADPRRITDAISAIPARYAPEPYEQLAIHLAESAKAGDSIAILGAGTITRLVPLLADALREHPPATGDAHA